MKKNPILLETSNIYVERGQCKIFYSINCMKKCTISIEIFALHISAKHFFCILSIFICLIQHFSYLYYSPSHETPELHIWTFSSHLTQILPQKQLVFQLIFTHILLISTHLLYNWCLVTKQKLERTENYSDFMVIEYCNFCTFGSVSMKGTKKYQLRKYELHKIQCTNDKTSIGIVLKYGSCGMESVLSLLFWHFKGNLTLLFLLIRSYFPRNRNILGFCRIGTLYLSPQCGTWKFKFEFARLTIQPICRAYLFGFVVQVYK